MSKKAINSREYEPDFKDLGALEPGACDLWKAYPKMLGTFVHLLRGTACMGHGKETGIRIPDFPDVEAWFEVPKSRAESRAEQTAVAASPTSSPSFIPRSWTSRWTRVSTTKTTAAPVTACPAQ